MRCYVLIYISHSRKKVIRLKAKEKEIEEELCKMIISLTTETEELLTIMDQKPMYAVSVLSQRLAVVGQKMRQLVQDRAFKGRLRKYVDGMNEKQKQELKRRASVDRENKKANDEIFKQDRSYMG